MRIPGHVDKETARIAKQQCKTLKRHLEAEGRRIEAVEVTWRADGQIGGFLIRNKISKKRPANNDLGDENRDPKRPKILEEVPSIKLKIRLNTVVEH
jgi:hypothetical protein